MRSLPADSFVAFRIAFGVLIAAGQLRFLVRGWVDEFYLAPANHLTYPAFDWVRPLPSGAMYALVAGLAIAGLLIAAGVGTRVVAAMFAVGFTYCELLDAALYLNHYWFITLTAVVLAVVPAPSGGVIPAVSVWSLRLQVGVVYFFAGIAKLNRDWLVRAEPLHTWLAARTDRPLIGPLLEETFVAFGFSWVGAAFDLTIVGWLLWRRSRLVAYMVLVVFHVATAALFQIGMFPWIMIALTPIFFAPTWPRRWVRALIGQVRRRRAGQKAWRWNRRGRAVGQTARRWKWRAVGQTARRWTWRGRRRRAWHSFRKSGSGRDLSEVTARRGSRGASAFLAGALVCLAATNAVLPLRHVAADGDVRWNDDGYLLSWRVMLTERASHVSFRVVDSATGVVEVVGPGEVLADWQSAAAMVRADLILSTAHLIARAERERSGRSVEVYADAVVAWNGRLRTTWIDPTVDLAALDRSAAASRYVVEAPQ